MKKLVILSLLAVLCFTGMSFKSKDIPKNPLTLEYVKAEAKKFQKGLEYDSRLKFVKIVPTAKMLVDGPCGSTPAPYCWCSTTCSYNPGDNLTQIQTNCYQYNEPSGTISWFYSHVSWSVGEPQGICD